MSTGVKKPPVAPKPKLAPLVKLSPPPIAPKPDLLLSQPSQPSPLLTQPSPAVLKRAKPAVAPKPCLSKPSAPAAPASPPPPRPRVPQTPSQECRGAGDDSLSFLNSRNGILSQPILHDSDYIIPTCSCGRQDCSQCKRLGNGNVTEVESDTLSSWPNRNATESTGTLVANRPGKTENGDSEKSGGVTNTLHLRLKDKPQRQEGQRDGEGSRDEEKLQGNKEERQRNQKGQEGQQYQTGSGDQSCNVLEVAETLTQTETKASNAEQTYTDSCNIGSNESDTINTPLILPLEVSPIHTPPQTVPPTRTPSQTVPPTRSPPQILPPSLTPTQMDSEPDSTPSHADSSTQCSRIPRLPTDLSVPAAPSKPLPVPLPRKPRKPALVRQDGLEASTQEGETKNRTQGGEVGETEGSGGRCLASEKEEHTQGVYDSPSPSQDPEAEEEPHPVPPPRQKSLSPCLHRALHCPPSLNRNTSHSLDLLSQPELNTLTSERRGGGDEEEEKEEEVEDGYGDFERYPITRSLPKQIKLSCRPPPVGMTMKASSAEEGGSPRAPPRKPQRHSLPAGAPPSITPPPPPPHHANTPMRELPATPQEKPAWRFPRPFFSRQSSSRHSSGGSSRGAPQGKAALLGGKQRAQSFSSADLLARADGTKRSLSFRKLLELRLSVRMLPRLLARSGQSLDCTSVEPGGGGRTVDQSDGSAGVSGRDGDGSVEYENVPLYEEIPEYMNLPFLSARLGWPLTHSLDPSTHRHSDSDVYEVQDPYESHCDYKRPHSIDYERGWHGLDDAHSEEEVHSSDEDDNSSTSSKEHLELSEEDRQQEDEVKRKKVVHIAQEIMSSEKVFVDVLKLLHIDFRDAVAKATRQNGKAVVEERILTQILYYLPQLYQLNRDLLRELEERVARWGDHQRLADIFVQKGPYLKMYSTYIRQFDNNVAMLDEQCRKNPGFAAVVREFEMSPRCASLALKHYLLKPVQRIPQYQLLLTDYLKNLPEDSSDYKDTQAALGIVKEVANHANDIMKQGDNFQKLMHIQYSLNGQHEIVQPGRVFLKEGTLMKLSRKVMQPRMFFLFNDTLLYTTPVQSGQYKLNSMLSLAGMKVSKPSQEAYQNELNIESVERSFILSASSATERDEWLAAIATAIDDHTRKKITFISSRSQEEADGVCDSGAPLGSKAPIWIPDLRATMCMVCTCEFTLTWRRHHCRACGKVVCQTCSSSKFYLEYLKNQPARVCDHCFVKLQENSDRVASGALSPTGRSGGFSFSRKQKKIPAALKEVSANTENSSMSGYLQRSKGNKKQWKRLWFVIKNKVLYTYAASEDVAALESQPLLGFFLREEKCGPFQKLQFKLYHKNTLFYIFKADDIPTAQRWIEAFQEAMIL
ncbi:FYVE, RhoGEF and PH domain-containing protein 6 [Salmo trutta]|uniref:FYVE, RhoGEF and PH domain containing 6 n=1 Tax=Salmo trutta TaxID=8032 RepID=A0A674B281_SALTR|nr:FYVE, RhoGEF and PH domain-containing protein 6-like [Salmo trutta]